MSHIIIWTENAFLCLERLYDFLAEKDIDSAERAILCIGNSVTQLAKFPFRGRQAEMPGLNANYRELLIPFGVAGYMALYVICDDMVHILSIKHCKENMFLLPPHDDVRGA